MTQAGWYEDPTQQGQLRYWDGERWSEHVHSAQVPHSPVAQPPAGQADSGLGSAAGQLAEQPAVPAAPAVPADGGFGQPGGLSPQMTETPPWAAGAERATGGAIDPARFEDIGGWIGRSIKIGFRKLFPALALMLAPIAVFLVGMLIVVTAVGSNAFDGITEEGGTIATEDISPGLMFVGVLVMLFAWVLLIAAALGVSRILYFAHAGYNEPIGSALHNGVKRVPKAIGYMILLYLAFFAVAVVVGGVVAIINAVAGEGAAVAVGVIAYIGFLVAAVWVSVKLAFFQTSLAVSPKGVSPFSASSEISNGRFWGVFGRMILYSIVVSFLLIPVYVVAAVITAVIVRNDPNSASISAVALLIGGAILSFAYAAVFVVGASGPAGIYADRNGSAEIPSGAVPARA